MDYFLVEEKKKKEKRNPETIKYAAYAAAFLVLFIVAYLMGTKDILKLDKQVDPKVKVAEIVEIPKDEEPSIVKVLDAAAFKTKNPELYAELQNGDTFLIYKTKTVVFRESENKVIIVYPEKQ